MSSYTNRKFILSYITINIKPVYFTEQSVSSFIDCAKVYSHGELIAKIQKLYCKDNKIQLRIREVHDE